MRLSLLTRSLWAIALAFTCAGPLSAQTFELSLEEGRVAARQAVLSGQFGLARDLALALTQADPNDRSALVVLAAVQPQLGEARDGRLAGARAFRLSTTSEDRYEAARLTALAAANENRYTLSQIWLRRAAANAPDERALRQTEVDYRGIRALNPWSINLGFSVKPTSNVNGGSEGQYNVIDGVPLIGALSGDAQALPGIAASADVRLSYVISNTPDQRTSLTARGHIRSVWLSDEGRTISPTSRNSDFGTQNIEFGVTHQRRLEDGRLTAQGQAGASWFGGDLNSGYLRGALSYSTDLSQTTNLSVFGQLEQTFDPAPWTANNERATVATTLTRLTDRGDHISGRLSYEAQTSDNLNERYESLTAQLSYAWAEPWGPVQMSATAGLSYSHYRDYSFLVFTVPGGREDTRLFGSLTAVFNELDYAGFVPTVTVGFQDTQSNVSRFERNEFSLDVGIRSSF